VPVLDTKPVSTLDVPLPMIGLDISPQQDVVIFSKKVPLEPEKMKELIPSPKRRGIDSRVLKLIS